MAMKIRIRQREKEVVALGLWLVVDGIL